jgi:uncharacterized protein
MMRIVVLGTGFVGSALIREFTARGHEVIAVSRSGGDAWPTGASSVTGSVYDPAFVARTTADADAVAVALPPLSAEGGIATAVQALLPAVNRHARLGIVGGSAVLPLHEGGLRLGDTAAFPDALETPTTHRSWLTAGY